MRISDWSSDVCSSDLRLVHRLARILQRRIGVTHGGGTIDAQAGLGRADDDAVDQRQISAATQQHGRSVITRVRTLDMGEVSHLQILARQRILARVAGGRRTVGVGFEEGDRKRVVEGKSVSVRVDLGGRRIIKKKKERTNYD